MAFAGSMVGGGPGGAAPGLPRARALPLLAAIALNGVALGGLLAMHRAPERVVPPVPVSISLVTPSSDSPRRQPEPVRAIPAEPAPTPPRPTRAAPARPAPPAVKAPARASVPPVIAAPVDAPSPSSVPAPLVAPTPVPAPTPAPPAIVASPAPAPAPAPASNAAPITTPAAPPAPPSLTPPRFDAAYLDNPAPAYPALARRMGEQGKVVLRVKVTPDGRAEHVEVSASSGSTRLDRAAADAVARWKFVPARRGDEPVSASVLVPINFSLEG